MRDQVRRPLKAANHDRESGQIMLLTLGVGVVLLALALVVASISSLYIQRKQLLAMADAAALHAASYHEETWYYTNESDLAISDQSVREAVEQFISIYPTGLKNVSVGPGTGTSDGRKAEVTLRAEATLPFVPWIAGAVPNLVMLEVTSTAELQY